MSRLKEVLVRLDADLRELSSSWALVGGWAVAVRAEPRATKDFHIAVAVDSYAEAESLVRAVASAMKSQRTTSGHSWKTRIPGPRSRRLSACGSRSLEARSPMNWPELGARSS